MAEMREPTFLVLTALATRPLHGWAVRAEVADLSDGTVQLRPGSLYGILERLSAEELISEQGDEVVEGRRRELFALTPKGRRELREASERYAEMAVVQAEWNFGSK